jgi:hypothetical protein
MGSGRAEFLEARAMRLLEQAEEERFKAVRFGENKDYDNFSILSWDQRYPGNGRTYTFVAIKCAGYWYTTGIFQHVKMSFDELVEKHLSKADEVYKVTQMEEL